MRLIGEERVLLLCRLLVHHPESLEKAKLLTETQWVDLLTLANRLWLGGALALSVKNSVLWSSLEHELQEYLDSLAVFSMERNNQLRELVRSITELLNSVNIDHLWLKGATALFNGVDQPVGRRWMMDLDVLVHEGDIDKVLEMLEEHGYVSKSNSNRWRVNHHAPGMVSPCGNYTVEVHFLPQSRITKTAYTTEELFQRKQPLDIGTLVSWQPSITDQVIHTFIHDQESHQHFDNHLIHLRHMIHFVWLVQIMGDNVDWKAFKVKLNNPELIEIVFYVTYLLYGLMTPLTNISSVRGQEYWKECLNKQVGGNSYPNLGYRSRITRSFSSDNLTKKFYGKSVWSARILNVIDLVRKRLTIEHWRNKSIIKHSKSQNYKW